MKKIEDLEEPPKYEHIQAKKKHRLSKKKIAVISGFVLILLIFLGIFIYQKYYYYKCFNCNVILISVDTLRADHLGYMGYCKNTSPNIDRLAAKSMVFENAISQSTWTLPSHVSMLSGLYPSTHGVNTPYSRIPTDLKLLPEILKENGYVTRGYTERGFTSAFFGFDRGFDKYTEASLDINFNESIRFIKSSQDKKFFLFFHTYHVHEGYVEQNDTSKYIRDIVSMGAYTFTDQELEDIKRRYDVSIFQVDLYIGKLLEKIRELGLEKKTIIAFTSDHGEGFTEHRVIGHGFAPYQEQIHVPLIIYSPTNINKLRVAKKVEIIDIMPTLLDLLNIDYEKSEGRSLIKNESNPFIFVHNKAVIRQDDMKVLFDGNESYLIGCNTTFVNKGNYINRLFNLSSLEKVYLFINDYKSLTANHSNNDFRDELDYFEIYLNSTIADNNCSIQEFYFGNFLLFNLSKDPKEENPIDDSESANILLNEFNLLLTRPRAKREKFDLYPNLLADKLKSLGYSN